MRSAFVRLGFICLLFLAALSGGYALSSSVGQGAVRREAETQLARLLRGRVTIERADLRIRDGFWIEGRGVQVYPSPDGPGLSSDHVAVRIDVLALIGGRFRVQDLVLDGIHLEIERSTADRWSPYPIDAIDRRGESGDDDLESKLGAFRVIDVITRVLLETPFIAQEITVRNGSVRLTDRFVRGPGEKPFEVQIDRINGQLLHDWIGNRANLQLGGLLSDEQRREVPIEVSGERRTDGSMNLSVAVTRLELESYGDYFQDQSDAARRARVSGSSEVSPRPFEGLLSGVVRFETPEHEHGVLEIDWLGREVMLGIPRAREVLVVNAPQVNYRTRVEIHPGRLRISEAELIGPDIRVEVSGDIERPLRGSSPANLAVHFRDVGVDALTRIADALPREGRDPLLRGLTSIEAGKIVRVGGSGTERLSVWQAVLRGERLDLPAGLSMMAEVSGVTISLGARERLSDLSATAIWTHDRLRIMRLRAMRDGVLTPQVNLTIEGFPVLFDQTETFDPAVVSNASLPGLPLLNQVFAQSPETEDEAVAAADQPVEIELDIDYVEHSALIWPLREAQIAAVFQERGQSFRIIRGLWGGARVSGDLLLTQHPDATLDAQLYVSAPPDDIASATTPRQYGTAAAIPANGNADLPWAQGNFVIDGMHGKHWPVGPTVASFAFRADEIELDDVRGRLVPAGTLRGNLRLDLADATALAFDTRFQIRDGDAGRLMEAIGFAEDFATGTFDVDCDLGGPILPDETAFALVEGKLEINGSDGEIRQRIPLVSALAHAAEGLNPTRATDALAYETISTVIEFERGRVATEEIKLDGPLRVFLSGTFDFARPGREIDAEIAIFIFRQVDQLLGNLPLLSNLIPGGKDRGLFGAFFDVEGTLEEPVLNALPMKSLTEGVPLPDVVKAPFSAIRQALQRNRNPRARRDD